MAPADGVARGGYTLLDASNGQPQVILIGTGSEVQLCVTARERLEAAGVPTRVVSMPCQEWFRAQDTAYRDPDSSALSESEGQRGGRGGHVVARSRRRRR